MALSLAALNESPSLDGSRAAREAARRTAEAEESQLASGYEDAMRLIGSGRRRDAAASLRGILAHPLTSGPDATPALTQLRFSPLTKPHSFNTFKTLTFLIASIRLLLHTVGTCKPNQTQRCIYAGGAPRDPPKTRTCDL